jgi:hypothetical protein
MFIRNLFPQVMMDAHDDGKGGAGDDIDKGTENQDDKGVDEGTKALSLEDVQKMIQSETDKIRTEYSKKLKDKDKELEDTKKEKMTEQEKAEYELGQLKENLSQRELQLLDKELTLKIVDLLKESELPLDAKDFLKGKDEESTIKNIESFKSIFNSALEVAVQNRFKDSGKDHENGSGSTVAKYTPEILKTMSEKEINKNWEQIQKDLSN